jgi:hypothetical protein
MTTTPPPDRQPDPQPDRRSSRPDQGLPNPATAAVPGAAAPATTEASGRLDLGVAQVAASALAAVTSAVAASTLGVAGTILGAGVGAVVATVGSAVYAHSLQRAGARIREFRPVDDGRWPAPRPMGGIGSSATGSADPLGSDREPDDDRVQPAAEAPPGATVPVDGVAADEEAATAEGRRAWKRGAVVVGAGFVLALAGITGAEALLGHPLSSSNESGTSVGRAVTGGSGGATDEPSRTPTTSTPSSTATESSPTATESQTATPTAPTSSVPAATSSAPVAPSASPSSPAGQTSATTAPEETAPETAPEETAPEESTSPEPAAPTTSEGG